MPTVCILLFTILIMVTVIPYAFSAVIKQLQAVWALEEQRKKELYFLKVRLCSIISVEAEEAAAAEEAANPAPVVVDETEDTTCSCG